MISGHYNPILPKPLNQEVVLGLDGHALKIWNKHNAQSFTSIERTRF